MAPQVVFETPVAALEQQKKQERLIREKVIPAAQLESAMRTKPLLVRDSPVDRSEYKQGWDVMRLPKEVRLLNDAPHAGVIELGARPFTPPFQPIYEWVKRKAGALGIARLKQGQKFRGPASLTGDQDQEARRVAWAIVRAIARRGLPPRYIMRKRLPDALRFLDQAFRKHLKRVADKP